VAQAASQLQSNRGMVHSSMLASWFMHIRSNYGEEEIAMKKYTKPSLKELGQLRMVTKFTCTWQNTF
jgi:hypothetical protein